MSNYITYKKVYTSGEMFTLTGKDFYGFAEQGSINNSDVTLGGAREVSTGRPLTKKNTYATDLFFSIEFKDRVIGDTNITLPYDLNKCLFGHNDNFTFELFRYKLDNLRYNNTYAYSKLFISSNKLPYTDSLRYAIVDTTTSSTFTIDKSDATTPSFKPNVKFANNHYLSAFGYIIGATAQTNLDYNDQFSLFACTSSSLICLTGSNTNLTIIEDTTGYETSDENTLEFKELGGIASTNKYLYLSDTGNNTVLRYDIAGYSNNDSSLKNKRNYIELVGGYGSITRQTKFVRPTKLAASNTVVAIFDSGNKVVKIFDEKFNFITRITSINFNTETMGAMGFDPDFKSLYILTYRDITTDGNISRIAYLHRYDGRDFRFKEEIILNDKLALDENIIDITFSGTDSNYWYFATNKTVYKKFKTRPKEIIGKYKTERLYLLDFTNSVVREETINNRWNFASLDFIAGSFVWNLSTTSEESGGVSDVNGLLDSKINSFSIFQSTSSYDKTIMLTDGRLYFFDEPITESYQRVLKDPNYNNYGSEGFSLNSDSFIQQSTINIEIHKLIDDVLQLKNNIVGRFAGTYNNDILELDNYNYNLDFSKLITQEIENFYIHGNEENLNGVLNRCFSLIHELQTKLINVVQPDVNSDIQTSYTTAGIIEI
ncbi:hypothetical protein N9Z65_01055 [bacterium]|nr:hypothetical protein [bacterium]